MPADIREQLDRAAGQPSLRPDVAAAMRRGERLRRRRRLAVTTVTGTAVATLVVVVLLSPAGISQLPPVGDRPSSGSIQQLEVFERPPAPRDRLRGGEMTYQMGAPGPPGVQRRTNRLVPPAPQVGFDELADSGRYPLDVDVEATRLAWQQDEVTVHLAPPTGEPVDPDLEPLDGEWLYVVVDRPGGGFVGSAPVPEPGTATWAGSVSFIGTRAAVLVVGDGLDTAHGKAGPVAVQDNVVLVEDVERRDEITLSGPSGDFTVSIPDDGTENP